MRRLVPTPEDEQCIQIVTGKFAASHCERLLYFDLIPCTITERNSEFSTCSRNGRIFCVLLEFSQKMSSAAPAASGWIVPRLQARVLAMPAVANNPKLQAMMKHEAGPFTSALEALALLLCFGTFRHPQPKPAVQRAQTLLHFGFLILLQFISGHLLQNGSFPSPTLAT